VDACASRLTPMAAGLECEAWIARSRGHGVILVTRSVAQSEEPQRSLRQRAGYRNGMDTHPHAGVRILERERLVLASASRVGQSEAPCVCRCRCRKTTWTCARALWADRASTVCCAPEAPPAKVLIGVVAHYISAMTFPPRPILGRAVVSHASRALSLSRGAI